MGISSNQNCNGEQDTRSELYEQVVDVNMNKKERSNRRISPRLKDIPQEKRPYYGENRSGGNKRPYNKMTEMNFLKENSNIKKYKIDHDLVDGQVADNGYVPIEQVDKDIVELEHNDYMRWFNFKSFVDNCINEEVNPRVEKTLRIFKDHCDRFEKEEEKGCQNARDSRQQSCSGKSNNENSSAKRSVKQGDLKANSEANSEMQNKNQVLHHEKILGHIPGIPVGYKFTSRAQMVAIGFHGHWLNGIDYVSKFSGKLKERYGCDCSLAVAIVMSGVYEDDVDYSNEVVYTGQGGNDGKKAQIKDQVMQCGNLALQNNMERCVPVRFIRVQKCAGSNAKVYTYCGLYKVVNCWSDRGISGCTVFKYRLKRLLNQPKVDKDQIDIKRASKGSPRFPGLVCQDISYGAEEIPIPVTNTIDNPPIAPPAYGLDTLVPWCA